MQVGIIGGGGAGLATAWLLEQDHEVSLFERDDRLGGHCQTVRVSIDGRERYVDAGFHYISERLQPTFVKLLRHLDAPLLSYRPGSTFHDRRDGWTVCLPPFGNLARMRGFMEGRTRRTLMGMRSLILQSIPLVEQDGDFSLTLEEFIGVLTLSDEFRETFLYPYLGSYWGVCHEEVRTFSARNALSYLVLLRPPVASPLPMLEMEGGMQCYADRMQRELTRTSIHCNADIRGMRREGEEHVITLTTGEDLRFDQVVLATNAEQALALVKPLPGSEPLCDALGKVSYFDTLIAVHGDTRLLPPNRATWSAVNGVFDGVHCSTTDRCAQNMDLDLFRSWITHGTIPPDPCYAQVNYRHPRPNPDYFRGQALLDPLQGEAGLWFAGMYVTHYDSHEGVIRSALRIARALAPESERVKALAG